MRFIFLCFIFVSCTRIGSEPEKEAHRGEAPTPKVRFAKAIELFNARRHASVMSLTQSDELTAREDLVYAASNYLQSIGVTHVVVHNRQETHIDIAPKPTTPLNRLAEHTHSLGNVSLLYDIAFLIHADLQSVRFDENAKRLRLPHQFLLNPNIEDDVLAHELIYLEIYADLVAKRPSPYFIRFKPQNIALADLNANTTDLQRWLHRLMEAGRDEQKLVNARLDAIFQATTTQSPVPSSLNMVETIWLSFLQNLTRAVDTAGFAVRALSAIANVTSWTWQKRSGIPEVVLKGLFLSGDSGSQFDTLIPLIEFKQADDTELLQIVKTNLTAAQATSQDHLELLAATREACFLVAQAKTSYLQWKRLRALNIFSQTPAKNDPLSKKRLDKEQLLAQFWEATLR